LILVESKFSLPFKLKKEKIIKYILVICFNLFWFYFIYSSELDTIPSFIQSVLKGLIIAMINISIIHNKLSEKSLILCCIIPFVFGFILLYLGDIIYIITFITTMFLIEIKIYNIYNILYIFNRFNEFFNILKNININSLIEFFNSLIEYMLHPMGGTPEPLKKTFSKISDVNYRTSEGEPSRPTVPRPSSPAVSESNDLYGSGGNSPEVSGAAGSNPEIRNNRPSNTSGRNSPEALVAGETSNTDASANNQARPITISPFNR